MLLFRVYGLKLGITPTSADVSDYLISVLQNSMHVYEQILLNFKMYGTIYSPLHQIPMLFETADVIKYRQQGHVEKIIFGLPSPNVTIAQKKKKLEILTSIKLALYGYWISNKL